MRALGKIPLFFEHPSSGDSSEGGGCVVVGVMPMFRQLRHASSVRLADRPTGWRMQ
jgi:hypothetical protein